MIINKKRELDEFWGALTDEETEAFKEWKNDKLTQGKTEYTDKDVNELSDQKLWSLFVLEGLLSKSSDGSYPKLVHRDEYPSGGVEWGSIQVGEVYVESYGRPNTGFTSRYDVYLRKTGEGESDFEEVKNPKSYKNKNVVRLKVEND